MYDRLKLMIKHEILMDLENLVSTRRCRGNLKNTFTYSRKFRIEKPFPVVQPQNQTMLNMIIWIEKVGMIIVVKY